MNDSTKAVLIGSSALVLVFVVDALLSRSGIVGRAVSHWSVPVPMPNTGGSVPNAVLFQAPTTHEMLSSDFPSIDDFDPSLSALIERGQFRDAHRDLLAIAAEMVDSGNTHALGGALSLLGQLSLIEQDFESAEVYFNESLSAYRDIGVVVGVAHAELQLGRMHVKLRERARVAGNAYDRLLLARWQLSDGQFDAARENLEISAVENLSINRFGAAARAYVSLVRLYGELAMTGESEAAAISAARLFASSGQPKEALAMTDQLDEGEGVYQQQLVNEIELLSEDFDNSVGQVARARDYQRLYNHYRSRGEDARAWQFRLRASTALGNASERAMYLRVPDALALLYASNRDRVRAREYLEKAEMTFVDHGRDDLTRQSRELFEVLY